MNYTCSIISPINDINVFTVLYKYVMYTRDTVQDFVFAFNTVCKHRKSQYRC